jgi:hypothetical protein
MPSSGSAFIRLTSALALMVASSAMPVSAQYRNGQVRPQAAAPKPDLPRTPAGEGQFRNSATIRSRPISPSLGLPLRFPVVPVVWGWGTMLFYFEPLNQALALEEGPIGGVQLDVQPWHASVFVDGNYVGRVEQFKGYYQHLEVVAGPHQIVIVETGHQPLALDLIVVPGRTTTYRGTLNELMR